MGGQDDDVEDLKAEVEDSLPDSLVGLEKAAEGVYVKASTIGSLEALHSFLTDMEIPVFGWGIGEVQLMDVKKASLMKEKKHPEYAIILAFDVKVNKDAQALADKQEMQIFTADIIYHLFDRFKGHMGEIIKAKKTEAEAVFPVIMKIDSIIHKKNPMILGIDILEGQLRIGTPICIPNVGPDGEDLDIGHVVGIRRNDRDVQKATQRQKVSVKIEQNSAQTSIACGRQFNDTHKLYSKITRSSIDSLKELFSDEMTEQDWKLIVSLKKI